jgi:phosphate transport system substrate-binding protein
MTQTQSPSKVSPVRILVILLIGAAIGAGAYFGITHYNTPEPAPTVPELQLGGTSVAYVIVENRWKLAHHAAKGVKVQYESTGSTKGMTNLIDKKYAISFTHAPMNAEQQKKAGGAVLHIPVLLCAVVPVYNVKELKGKPPLKFDGETLGAIFLGKITKWNDPAIKKLNEGADLPDKPIKVIHRSDSSGTTLIFADYLHGASEAWKKEIGPAKGEIKWPVGEGQARSERLAFHVSQTDGAIGYVDLLHAQNHEISFGAVQNHDKSAFIQAKPENLTAAAQSLKDIPDDLTFHLTNRPGKDAYPICGTIWAACYQDQPAATQTKVVDFLTWVTHEGQEFAPSMLYAPLPKEIVERADAKIKTIKTAK